MKNQATVMTHAPTSANKHNLAPGFLQALETQYAGTRLGRQEMDGELITDVEGALFTHEMIEAARAEIPSEMDRIVIAIDPPASHHAKSDECGMIVAGAKYDDDRAKWRAYILEDISVEQAKPEEWAARAIKAYDDYGASCVLAEVNQGGNMVESILRQVDPRIAFRPLRAKHGKVVRAEPAAALYAQGRVKHCGIFEVLEDQMQMMSITGFKGTGSPDRVDALVWALTELMITPSGGASRPQVRTL